jgi:hypothetical protein
MAKYESVGAIQKSGTKSKIAGLLNIPNQFLMRHQFPGQFGCAL